MSGWYEDAVEAGAQALMEAAPADPDVPWDDDDWTLFHSDAAAVVDAVAPIIRAEVRERIAQEIEAYGAEWGCSGLYCDGVRYGAERAARVARGGVQ